MNIETPSMLASFLVLFEWDSHLWEIIGLSVRVSLSAVIIAIFLGLPLGALLAVKEFRNRQLILLFVNTLMSMPPVVVGLFVYLMLSRTGPLGVFNLLYSPTAMIIAQVILITPIIIALSNQHLQLEWRRIGEQLRSLHVRYGSALLTLLWETRIALATVVLAGFGRAIAEIGAVMIVGGNIDHLTRVMTTAIALETSKGNLELAIALGLVLLCLSLFVNMFVQLASYWSERETH